MVSPHMVQSIDDVRRRNRSESGGRVPPHNLQAEESLLGAMLLSRDAIAAAVEICAADDFYKPAHGHVFEAVCSLYGQGEPADPVTVADELRRADLLDAIGGTADPDLAAGQHAGDRQRRPLRPDRRGARPAAPADRRGRRDRRAGLRRARRRRGGRRPGRVDGLRGGRAPGDRHPQAAARPAVGEPRPPRGAVRPGRVHHRRPDRLPRPRRAAVRPAAVQPDHRRRPAGHGQDQLRPGHGRPRRHGGPRPGAVLLARDEPRRDHPRLLCCRGPGRRHAGSATASCSSPTGPRSATPSAASARRRSTSTTTPT